MILAKASLRTRKSRWNSGKVPVLSFGLPERAGTARTASCRRLHRRLSIQAKTDGRFESHADAVMTEIFKGRAVNPLAEAIAGRALILAGLLLLRRP
jgi:hypothetical protein